MKPILLMVAMIVAAPVLADSPPVRNSQCEPDRSYPPAPNAVLTFFNAGFTWRGGLTAIPANFGSNTLIRDGGCLIGVGQPPRTSAATWLDSPVGDRGQYLLHLVSIADTDAPLLGRGLTGFWGLDFADVNGNTGSLNLYLDTAHKQIIVEQVVVRPHAEPLVSSKSLTFTMRDAERPCADIVVTKVTSPLALTRNAGQIWNVRLSCDDTGATSDLTYDFLTLSAQRVLVGQLTPTIPDTYFTVRFHP